MSPNLKRKVLHYDLNVPLSSSTSSSSSSYSSIKRKHQAHLYQTRLHQLGYHGGIAFCHTAYGRLNLEKDDADATLPWKDLIQDDANNNNNDNNNNNSSPRQKQSFGRMNSLGMKIYRRLNIVVEEVSDVSRILLPVNNNKDGATTTSSSSKKSSSSSQQQKQKPTTVSELLQRYDIISLQPMNEPALQNICELLLSSSSSSSISSSSSSGGSAVDNSANNITNTNNASCIDILVLEYATGSRGGHGLPYKLRKDYLVKALQSGVTFELCYGTAILDAKRRQGFLRTLLDFQSTYNGIQKKHALLLHNNHNHGNLLKTKKCNVKFPLLLGSGARQNYTRGTDEGVMALRTPYDVRLMVCHLVGGNNNGWFDNDDNNDKGVDDGDGNDDDDEMMHRDGKKRKSRKNRRTPVLVTSPAEKVLERAGDRASGVVVVRMDRSSKGRHATIRRGCRDGRSRVVGMKRTRNDDDDDDDDDDGIVSSKGGSSASLIDWLSEPLHQKANVVTKEDDTMHGKDSQDKMEGSKRVAEGLVNNDGGTKKSSDRESDNNKVGRSLVLDKDDRPDSRGDEEEDLEDGFIAL